MEKLKVGILGLRRGRTFLNNFLHLDNCIVVGACDRYEKWREPAREILEPHGGKVLNEFDELLELKPDAVAVATNAKVHAEHSMQAMEAGCHVVCEIPSAYTMDELVRLRDTVERTGRTYMCAENSCFLDFFRYWRKWVLDGRFGEVSCADGEYLHYLPKSLVAADGERLSPSEAAGRTDVQPIWRADQPPIQYLTHDLGPLLEVLDDRAVSVTCRSAPWWCKEAPLRSDAQIGLFETEKGRLIRCMVTLNTRRPSEHRYRLFGTDGGTEFCGYEKHVRVFYGDREEREGWDQVDIGRTAKDDDASTGHGGTDLKVARSFANAVLEGKSPPIDVYRGIDFTLPGIIAAQSADLGGVPLSIPNLRRGPFTGTTFWDYVPLPEKDPPAMEK